MKRLVYGIVAAGLAVGLVGCGESGGGVWPASPASPALTGGQVQPLGGDALDANKALLGLGNAVTTGGVADTAGVVMAANPALTDFGITLPSSIGGTGISPFASIRGATNKRSLSNATTAGMKLETASNDFVKFSASKTYTYSNYAYTFAYDWNVKFLDSTGKALAMDTSSTRTDFWAFSTSGVSMTSVSAIQYYGTAKVTVKTSASSGSSSSMSNTFDYTITSDMGSVTDPCMVGNVNATSGSVYVKSSAKWGISGSINGTNYNTSITSKIYGDASYTLGSTSHTGLYKYDVMTTSTTSYNFGYGTMVYVTPEATAKMVAEGTKYSYYINDTLVFTYPSSTGSSHYYY